MKEVNIYVRGICINSGEDKELKEGKYIALLEYQNRHKQLVGNEVNTTSNRLILKGVIDSLKLLKETCIVNVHATTVLGFNSKSSPNRDLIDEALKIIVDNGHVYNEIVSKKYQDYFAKELKKKLVYKKSIVYY